jgi:hypothetical protein
MIMNIRRVDVDQDSCLCHSAPPGSLRERESSRSEYSFYLFFDCSLRSQLFTQSPRRCRAAEGVINGNGY